MGEVLSQNEIDELLKALNTGEIDLKDIQEPSQQKHIKTTILLDLQNLQKSN